MDANTNLEQEEESYWQWKEKQLEYLKLPLFKPTPKSARNKKILPPIDCSESRNANALNTSRYVVLPDLDSTDEEEEERDPIAKLSRRQKKEELERKDRWIAKFEKESREVDA